MLRFSPSVLVAGAAVFLSACSGSGVFPPDDFGPAQTYTISGTVLETSSLAPVEGVTVRVAQGGLQAVTDANGTYSVSGVSLVTSAVSASKVGYATDTRTVQVYQNLQLDFRVLAFDYNTLSGIVFEQTADGPMPVEGVEVYCDGCGSPVGHTFAYTDQTGSYSFDFTLDGANPLQVRKTGYAVAGSTTPIVKGDTRFDIELIRR